MPEYSIEFSKSLVKAAQSLLPDCESSFDSKRAVLYLSLLSSEISLKGLLETAGKPVVEIIRCQHRLTDLLNEIDKCFVNVKVSPGRPERVWIPATSIRAKTIKVGSTVSTVGEFLTSENNGASQYPNEVRYGPKVVHFPPEAALTAAQLIISWAEEHWDKFSLSKPC